MRWYVLHAEAEQPARQCSAEVQTGLAHKVAGRDLGGSVEGHPLSSFGAAGVPDLFDTVESVGIAAG